MNVLTKFKIRNFLISVELFTMMLFVASCTSEEPISISISGISPTTTATLDDTLNFTVGLNTSVGISKFYVSINEERILNLFPATYLGETTLNIDVNQSIFDMGVSLGSHTLVYTLIDRQSKKQTVTQILTVSEFIEENIFTSAEGIGGTDVTWTSDKIYVLNGYVFVNGGQTLTIEPGTVIKGRGGQGSGASALIVARGGKLQAVGTSTLPIVFTSYFDDLSPKDLLEGNYASPNLKPDVSGLWGGLIMLGKATISASAKELQIEGIPSSESRGLYGGSIDNDNSGTLTYVSVRHGGTNIGSGNEINGITFGAVGSETTVSNIEVVGNADDGIEWFGGNVSVSNVLIWNAGDDGLDTDNDWVGTCSNFLIISPDGSALELDGPEGEGNRGVHLFINGTVYADSYIDHLIDFDKNTNAAVQNIYFYGWEVDYRFIQDEDLNKSGDQNFSPIETFGGDGNGVNRAWEYTLTMGGSSVEASEIFVGVDSDILSEVGRNENTVGGPDASTFSWTYAGSFGMLATIGL